MYLNIHLVNHTFSATFIWLTTHLLRHSYG